MQILCSNFQNLVCSMKPICLNLIILSFMRDVKQSVISLKKWNKKQLLLYLQERLNEPNIWMIWLLPLVRKRLVERPIYVIKRKAQSRDQKFNKKASETDPMRKQRLDNAKRKIEQLYDIICLAIIKWLYWVIIFLYCFVIFIHRYY